MAELQFDVRGHLEPHGINDLPLKDFEDNFVTAFENSTTRLPIFEELKRYNTDLIEMVGTPQFQWINGSFVTQKLNPNDVDVVTFLDFELYDAQKTLIDKRFDKWSVRNYYSLVDAHIVACFPKTHALFANYQSDYFYWLEWLSHSRKNRQGIRFKKGFIQLKF